jgi:DNA-binding NarL/FixJ family response regulator
MRLWNEEAPQARILMLTVSEDVEDLLQALRAGARRRQGTLVTAQREILGFLARGASNKEIACTLDLAESTG